MSHQENWLEKQFDFEFPASRYIMFLLYLCKTPARLESTMKALPRELLILRTGGSWSIQENAGHFLTVESLFLGRLDDYENNAPVLRPARFENNPTDAANFNEKDICWILDQFRTQRQHYLHRLGGMHPECFSKSILHPRLNKPMRLCDMLFFHVVHDRHHLERITELKELIIISNSVIRIRQ